MSLYADEDVELYAAPGGQGVAAAPTDPFQAFTVAISMDEETPAQADALIAAGKRFEEHPDRLPDLSMKLLPMVVEGEDRLLRAWTLDMLSLTVGRSALSGAVKLEVAQASLDSLSHLLNSGSSATIRAVVPIFSTIYPIVFRYLATTSGASPADMRIHDVFQHSKQRILSFALDVNSHQSVGVKAAAWKFIQKVLLVGTRASTGGDPRLQGRASSDVNVALVVPESLLNAAKLEEEASMLRTQLVTQLYALSDPALLHPIINSFPPLVKTRPTLAPLIVSSMASWSPSAMEAAGRPPMQVRSVEKTLRAVMGYIYKIPALVGFSAQLEEALGRQKQRMEQAWTADADERRRRRANIAAGIGKHPLGQDAESSTSAAKRARLEVKPGTGDGRSGVMVDVSQLALEPVIEVVLAGLAAVTDEQLARAFENARQAIAEDDPDAVHVLAPSLFKEEVKTEDEEAVNPLDMDMDDEELLMEPVEPELEEPVMIADFKLPPAEPLPVEDKTELVDFAVQRIWDSGSDLSRLADLKISDGPRSAVQPKEMWMLLLARISSRGGEDKRRLIGEFVAKDFGVRSKFATVWLNEEWLAKRRGEKNEYESGLMDILKAYIPTLDVKDQSLSQFLVGLPEVPEAAIDALEPLCEDNDRMIVGFLSLRELAEARPPVRPRALKTLLQLCTHPDRKVRVMAITTVRRWIPSSPMSTAVIAYALGVLRRLTVQPTPEASEGEHPDGDIVDKKPDVDMADGTEGMVESKYLTTVSTETIPQYVELAFALSRRDQNLLDDIFSIFPELPDDIQHTVEEGLAPLIRSLGPTKKLLDILRNFPRGGEKLALRVVTTLSAEGSGPLLVPVIRGLMSERELNPRFIIPVIGELDKSDIESQIPRIVSLLVDKEARDVVKTAFASVLQKMTPADLLVCLHGEEAGLKQTVDAIGICFQMTTVFRSDVLANAMQRIVDLPTPLPLCFIRTVIQAVRTYKSLIPMVANNVLPKVVKRRVWEIPALWEGFVPLVRVLGQASFGALLQMPVERIREVVEKQPVLKAPLKAFLASKPATRGQLAQIFGDESSTSASVAKAEWTEESAAS